MNLVVTACALLEGSVSQLQESCPVAFGTASTVAFLNGACALSGCVLKVVQALRDIQTCRSQGMATGLVDSTWTATAVSSEIAKYQYLCTVKAAGGAPASNTYCLAETNTWPSTDDESKTCAQYTASGCCLTNFVAMREAINPQAALVTAQVVKQKCNIDIVAVRPCQPPGWANISFNGTIAVRVFDLLRNEID